MRRGDRTDNPMPAKLPAVVTTPYSTHPSRVSRSPPYCQTQMTEYILIRTYLSSAGLPFKRIITEPAAYANG